MRVLLSRRDTIRLLILAELITNKNINQREIANRLNLTPQAISEYFKELTSEGLVRVIQKGFYEITEKGIDWLVKNLFDLHLFSEDLLKRIYSYSLVAIAVGEIRKGDEVRYWFDKGLIYCTKDENPNSIALTTAEDGEEVLIKPKEEFKPPEKGRVTVFKVPDVCQGGSRAVDLKILREFVAKADVVVALGVEGLISCRKVGVEPVFFGAKDACVESAHHGCNVVVVCTESLIDDMLRRLIDEDIPFEVKP